MNTQTDRETFDKLISRVDRKDITLKEQSRLVRELQLVNNKLVESEKLKTQFLSNIRNEINNPITSILGLSQIIAKGQHETADLKRISQLIHQEVIGLDFQLRNIFIAAELESGMLFPEPHFIDVRQLIAQLEREFDHLIQKKKIKLDISFSLANEDFYSDGEKIHLILINLLSNAIKYSPNEGLVNLHVSYDHDQLCITLRDYGIGIGVEKHKDIFDRFKQLDSGTTKNHQGHGLGLSVTRELVDLLGGTIELASKRNHGCQFKVFLPHIEPIADDNIAVGENEFLFETGNEIF